MRYTGMPMGMRALFAVFFGLFSRLCRLKKREDGYQNEKSDDGCGEAGTGRAGRSEERKILFSEENEDCGGGEDGKNVFRRAHVADGSAKAEKAVNEEHQKPRQLFAKEAEKGCERVKKARHFKQNGTDGTRIKNRDERQTNKVRKNRNEALFPEKDI